MFTHFCEVNAIIIFSLQYLSQVPTESCTLSRSLDLSSPGSKPYNPGNVLSISTTHRQGKREGKTLDLVELEMTTTHEKTRHENRPNLRTLPSFRLSAPPTSHPLRPTPFPDSSNTVLWVNKAGDHYISYHDLHGDTALYDSSVLSSNFVDGLKRSQNALMMVR